MVRASKYRHWALQLVCGEHTKDLGTWWTDVFCICQQVWVIGLVRAAQIWRWKWQDKDLDRIRVKVFSDTVSTLSDLSVCVCVDTVLEHTLAPNMGFQIPSRSFPCLDQILAAVWRSKMMLAACILYQGRHGQWATTWWGEVVFSDIFSGNWIHGSSPC